MATPQETYRELLGTLGAPAVNALFPNDFEVYMMALELVDSRGDSKNYFSFPVLPDQIIKSEKHITSVKKTMGGVVSLTNNTFVPEDITINGNFGRNFKVLIGRDNRSFRGININQNTAKEAGIKNVPEFDASVKTGYGCTKILQNIHAQSVMLDSYGKPHRLYFYNPTLGEAHLVETVSLTLRQDKGSSNAMWGYSLVIKTLAIADDIKNIPKSSLTKVMTIGLIQKGLNIVSKDAKSFISDGRLKLYDNIIETVNLKFITK